MLEVTKNVYVETKYMAANVGCVVTKEGLIIIDTPILPEEALDFRNQLREISDLDIAYVIYTHQHVDHVIGSTYLTRRTIAYQGAVNGIKYLTTNLDKDLKLLWPELYEQRKAVFDNMEVILPQITFSKEMTLDMGNKILQLSYAGGHSSASIMIYLPEDKVLFAGDNVLTGELVTTANGRYASWIETLRRMEEMDINTIVPGHGNETCGKETATKIRIYFEAMRDRVRELVSSDATKEEAMQQVDLKDSLPVPYSKELDQQVAFDIGIMYDQIKKGVI